MEPAREHFVLLPSWTPEALRIVVVIAAIAITYSFYLKFKLYKPRGCARPSLSRLKLLILMQSRMLRERYRGIAHAMIMTSILVLLLGTISVFLEYDILQPLLGLRFLRGLTYLIFEFALDLFGLLLILGLLLALIRRCLLEHETSAEDLWVLLSLLAIAVSGFLIEGLRLALRPSPWGDASFIGYLISKVVPPVPLPRETTSAIYTALWWFHGLLALVALVLLPRTKIVHSVMSVLKALLLPAQPVAEYPTDFDLKRAMKEIRRVDDVKVGVGTTLDLKWFQRFDVDLCVDCGRCERVCPAFRADKNFISPRTFIQKLRRQMLSESPEQPVVLFGGVVSEEELWSCTMCSSCVETCPLLINQRNLVLDLRRYIVMNLGKVPSNALFNILIRGNPYGLSRSDRLAWTKDLEIKELKEGERVDVLYWVGCAGAYDPRAQQVARSIVRILRQAGVDFAILRGETCCGEPARRFGDELLFQELAYKNIETLSKYDFSIILTSCPHCYNVLKNEYPQLGGRFKVRHHTQLIEELIASGRLRPVSGLGVTVTYHDPCYLGYHNGIYDPPRRIIRAISGVKFVEMKWSRDKSFCCGGGGGGYWMEIGKINVNRLRDALEANPEIVAVSCPYCISMLEDAVKIEGLEEKIRIKDVAELLVESMAGG